MQNQIEIEEKEIEKEIKEEKLKILLIILSYLSPGEIIMFSLTCKQAQYICSDYLLWKQIAIKFQDYFKWNSFYFDYYSSTIKLKAIQFKIQKKNQNNPKQKQIKELSKTNEKIKNYFDNSNSTIIQIGPYSYDYKANFISIKSERIIYIQNIKNPKQEIEKKGKMIFERFRKAKQRKIAKERYQKKYYNPNYDIKTFGTGRRCFFGSRIDFLTQFVYTMNGMILSTTLIILNIYIDSKKEIPIFKLFLLGEISLIFGIFWVLHSKSSFYSLQDYYNLLRSGITGLIFMIIISLKTTKTFSFIPWLIILLPPIILLSSFLYQFIEFTKQYPLRRDYFILLSFMNAYLITALLFTGFKLDGFIQIKYSKLIYLFFLFIIAFFAKFTKQIFTQDFYFISFFFIGFFIIILSILFFYGDGLVDRLYFALVPIYTILFIPYLNLVLMGIFLIISSGFEFFKLIFKFNNEN
ncbi:f-box only protein [Anaeramoeba ignava]|uniref:F-box only protein n=1 Tax=Anaeramoeba ignava TaxID=1746090 RepID=A0A9Q0LM13_ANAIG|nr:f-box only protein [Anaeramoeba ignava]